MEVWLKADFDNKAYFPNDAGVFTFSECDLYVGAMFCVEGPDLPQPSHAGHSMSISSTAQTSGTGSSASYLTSPPPSLPTPTFKSVIPKASKGQSHNLKPL